MAIITRTAVMAVCRPDANAILGANFMFFRKDKIYLPFATHEHRASWVLMRAP
ncbi:MAG: hypothetical protein U5L74_12255 [Ideonella sp.]|nr:hypothetical protein [Ideonella sp.]